MEYINITRDFGNSYSIELSNKVKDAFRNKTLQIIEGRNIVNLTIFGILIKNNTDMIISVAGRDDCEVPFDILSYVHPNKCYFPEKFQQYNHITFRSIYWIDDKFNFTDLNY